MNIGFDAKRIFHNQTGLGNYGRDLVRILSAHYPEHGYYLYNPKASGRKLFGLSTPNVTERLPRSRFDRTFPSVWRSSGMVHDLRKDHIELFHGLSGELPIGLRRHGIRSVVTIHDLIFVRYPALYHIVDRTIYLRKFKHAALHADRIIAISEQTKQDVVAVLGVDAGKVEVIYQGCHPAFKQRYTDAEKQAVLEKHGLPPDFILNVGTIEARKNALVIIKAIASLDVHLVIAGKATPYLDELKTYIEQHRLSKKVTFIHGTSIDELAKLYQSARLFVYPSLFEGFGIPIIEALYSGVPVITSNTGCFPEAAGPSSKYIPPDDVAALTQTIQTVLGDASLRMAMIAHGLDYARRFDDAGIARQVHSLYRALCP
ncbi:glycosyltransferase family 4 protein [Parapedobacter deserti]|uniref:Glycosyltransferase family 4 protein n=1 Tax=Parapedobacter deserti TaxID=1912957 RepID=A0ABV7JP41_9SPHI